MNPTWPTPASPDPRTSWTLRDVGPYGERLPPLPERLTVAEIAERVSGVPRGTSVVQP